ncbi:hypothetical protein BDB01DRAFT_771815 [Pilobolus umbonatus]|nr:hypothetical protein BDB01DRAFT_771815 [Pilobolus umbonatus]
MVMSPEAKLCSEQPNHINACSPTVTDIWVNGSDYDFIWNANLPFYSPSEYMSIYIYYIINYSYVSAKNFTYIPTKEGSLEVTVDDSWFISTLEAGDESRNQTAYVFYLPSAVNATVELGPESSYPRPIAFTLTQVAPPGPNSSGDSVGGNGNSKGINNSNNNSNSAQYSNDNSKLPGWAIGVIILAVVAFIFGAVALLWSYSVSRRSKRNNKLIPLNGRYPNDSSKRINEKDSYDNNSTASIAHMVPPFRSTDSVPMSTAGAENASSIGTSTSRRTYPSPLSPNKISSSDAILLGDTFRSTLGRSDWNNTVDAEDEEMKRRKLGEALLQRQLEEDGTSVKHAGRFTRVKSLAEIQNNAIVEQSQPSPK